MHVSRRNPYIGRVVRTQSMYKDKKRKPNVERVEEVKGRIINKRI